MYNRTKRSSSNRRSISVSPGGYFMDRSRLTELFLEARKREGDDRGEFRVQDRALQWRREAVELSSQTLTAAQALFQPVCPGDFVPGAPARRRARAVSSTGPVPWHGPPATVVSALPVAMVARVSCSTHGCIAASSSAIMRRSPRFFASFHGVRPFRSRASSGAPWSISSRAVAT